jgi:predicted phage terminase large subunit-like protein
VWTAYRIGLEPHKTNLLVQVSDQIAKDNSAAIADIIKNNSGWKLVFPNVVPSENKWGAEGYTVINKGISDALWRQQTADVKDPTFVGLGYDSSSIIGKRPTGVLVIDDILDEGNTSSDKEMKKVDKILRGTIFPAANTPGVWVIFVFTPWREDDPVLDITSLDLFHRTKTPFLYEDEDGEFFQPLNCKVKLTWPERFTIQDAKNNYDVSKLAEFSRMYLLDLSKTDNKKFVWMEYPHEEIKFEWPMSGGCDFASAISNRGHAKTDNDFFALAYVQRLPQGGVVIMDGIAEVITLERAVYYIDAAQNPVLHPNYSYTTIEGDGTGDTFIQTLQMFKPGLRLNPQKTKGVSKTNRLMLLAPYFANGTIKISDANTPFLNELRKEMRQFPESTHDDAMDSVYWAVFGMLDILVMPKTPTNGILPQQYKERRPNPYNSLGRR